MSSWDDHFGDMATTDPASAQFLDEMRSLADVDAPEPSDELEQLFASALPLAERGHGDASRPAGHRVQRHPLLAAPTVIITAHMG